MTSKVKLFCGSLAGIDCLLLAGCLISSIAKLRFVLLVKFTLILLNVSSLNVPKHSVLAISLNLIWASNLSFLIVGTKVIDRKKVKSTTSVFKWIHCLIATSSWFFWNHRNETRFHNRWIDNSHDKLEGIAERYDLSQVVWLILIIY